MDRRPDNITEILFVKYLIIIIFRRPRRQDAEAEEGDSDDSDDDEDEEESEDEEEEEEEGAGGGEAKKELTRAERRELKKKKAQDKQPSGSKDADEEEANEDEELINPNHITKKLNISDLGAPRELSRRERYVILEHGDRSMNTDFREQKEKKEAQERYWKVGCTLYPKRLPLKCLASSFTFKARQTKPRRILRDLRRSGRNARKRKLNVKLKLRVCHPCHRVSEMQYVLTCPSHM